ncbi:MAG: hypothetical protein IJ104_05230 [Methanobrevibacter sp.]|nr:hypothetical protein [Methanobrevibacter sp.]
MSFKKILFIFLIILVLSINAVSADEASLDDFKELVSDSNGTVELTQDYSFENSNNGFEIRDRDIAIDGRNHTFDGTGTSRIFTIRNSTVCLENINFVNARGEALDISDSNVMIKNCRFINNTAVWGAAFLLRETSNATVDGCLFENNSAGIGSTIFLFYNRNAELTITNSVFKNNAPRLDLGLLSYDYRAYIENPSNILDFQGYYSPESLNSNFTFNLYNVTCNNKKFDSFSVKSKDDLDSRNIEENILFEIYDKERLVLKKTLMTSNGRGVGGMYGEAYLDLKGLAPGNYTLVAKWNNMSCERNIHVTVDLNFSVSVDSVYYGDEVIVRINVFDDIKANGTLKLYYNQTQYPPVNHDYETSFEFKDTNFTFLNCPVGTHLVEVEYPGDSIYAPAYIGRLFTVRDGYKTSFDLKTKILADDIDKFYANSKRLTAKLVDDKNDSLAYRNVSVKINGVTYYRTTDGNGEISFPVNLNSGEYLLAVTFEGDDDYAPSRNVSKITIRPTFTPVSEFKMYVNKHSQNKYLVKCLDSNGNALKGGQVEFNINGVLYKRNIGEDGIAGLNINLDQGNYIITALNPVTGEQTSSLLEILPLITNNHDLVKYYRNSSQFHVTLRGVDNLENQKITFNINGVFYDRYTDENGTAQLNINLDPGNYTITSEFDGCRVSNNVRVLPLLKGSDLVMHYMDGSTFDVSLNDNAGNIMRNSRIRFNINGVMYERYTDDNGIARLNIRLMPGEYIITSSHGRLSIGNKITVI